MKRLDKQGPVPPDPFCVRAPAVDTTPAATTPAATTPTANGTAGTTDHAATGTTDHAATGTTDHAATGTDAAGAAKPSRAGRLARDRTTVVLYVVLGILGYLLNGLGSVLGPLQRQLDVDRTAVAFYPSLFAVALVLVGLAGGGLTRRFGHRTVLRLAVCGMAAGALLLGAPIRLVTLLGAAVLGGAGALIVLAVPPVLAWRHRDAAPAALGEANAVSSFASVLAPSAVALTAVAGADWRLGYALPILPVAIAVAVLLRAVPDSRAGHTTRTHGHDTTANPGHNSTRTHGHDTTGTHGHDTTGTPGTGPRPHHPTAGLEPGRLLPRWVDVLLAVSVEFCLVFWAADAFAEWHGASTAAAPALAAGFLLGMALARTAAAALTTGRHPLAVVLVACATAGAGFCVFWSAPNRLGAVAGLLVAGLGVALLYPVTLSRAVAAWPHDMDRASARAALASGAAIGAAPLLLAGLADRTGLRTAYLIVPALLAALAAHAAAALLHAQRQPGSRGPAGTGPTDTGPTDTDPAEASPAGTEAPDPDPAGTAGAHRRPHADTRSAES